MMVKLLSSVAALLLTTQIHAESAAAPTPSYLMPLAEKAVLTDLIRVNDQLYVAVGDRGHLLVSCLLYTSPSPRDKRQSRMPSSA